MKKDIVIIPCWDRPEYLAVCLACIATNEEAKGLHYFFALDFGYKPRNIEVIKNSMELLGASYQIYETPHMRLGDAKQSYNILNAYNKCIDIAEKYIFLIEDDIFLGKGYFKAMYQIHEREKDCFCVIGSRNFNPMPFIDQQTMEFDSYNKTRSAVYQSLGVCWDKEVLRKYIRPHISLSGYFLNMKYYCERLNPKSSIKGQFHEQDGLISRIQELSGKEICYPNYPRCYHAGIYGYHRKSKLKSKPFHVKYQYIIENCFDAEKMKLHNQFNDVFIPELDVTDDMFKLSKKEIKATAI